MRNELRYQDLSAYENPKGFRGRSVLVVQLWWIIQATLFRFSPQVAYGWRRSLLRLFGAKIGERVLIRPSVTTTYPWKIQVGAFSWLGDDVTLYSLGNISIGDHSVISQNCYLCAGSHSLNSRSFAIQSAPITIGNEVWIAADVFVGPGCSIGDGAVIGARSSVFNDLPPETKSIGSPARPTGPRGIPDEE